MIIPPSTFPVTDPALEEVGDGVNAGDRSCSGGRVCVGDGDGDGDGIAIEQDIKIERRAVKGEYTCEQYWFLKITIVGSYYTNVYVAITHAALSVSIKIPEGMVWGAVYTKTK